MLTNNDNDDTDNHLFDVDVSADVNDEENVEEADANFNWFSNEQNGGFGANNVVLGRSINVESEEKTSDDNAFDDVVPNLPSFEKNNTNDERTTISTSRDEVTVNRQAVSRFSRFEENPRVILTTFRSINHPTVEQNQVPAVIFNALRRNDAVSITPADNSQNEASTSVGGSYQFFIQASTTRQSRQQVSNPAPRVNAQILELPAESAVRQNFVQALNPA